MDKQIEYQSQFPKKFTHTYLTNEYELSCLRVLYDEHCDEYYYQHFFRLGDDMNLHFRYYKKSKSVVSIDIQDSECSMSTDNGCEFSIRILDAMIPHFDIENQLFNEDFDFDKYEI